MPEISAKVAVERNNVPFRQLQLVGAPEVSVDNTREIKRQLSASFKTDPDIQFLIDRFFVHILIDGYEYPMGKYIAAEAPEKVTNTNTVTLRGYDPTYLLKLSKIEERAYFPEGRKYTDIIHSQLVAAGVVDFIIEESDLMLPASREDWDPGADRLDITNTLLAEINYNSVWADNNGVLRVTKYKSPEYASVNIFYAPGKDSTLYPGQNRNIDMFERPNIFKLYCSNPDIGELVAISENNDPASPISTVNTGRRVLSVRNVANVATVAELQSMAEREKFSNLLPLELVEIKTGPNPAHSCLDYVGLTQGGRSGIYQEVTWRMALGGTGEMRHTLKRVLL